MGYIKKRTQLYGWRCYSTLLRLLLQTIMRVRIENQVKWRLPSLVSLLLLLMFLFNIRKCGQTNCVKNCYCIGCCLCCCCCCYGCCSCFCSISMNMVRCGHTNCVKNCYWDSRFDLLSSLRRPLHSNWNLSSPAKKQFCLKWSSLCLCMQCWKSIPWFDQPM